MSTVMSGRAGAPVASTTVTWVTAIAGLVGGLEHPQKIANTRPKRTTNFTKFVTIDLTRPQLQKRQSRAALCKCRGARFSATEPPGTQQQIKHSEIRSEIRPQEPFYGFNRPYFFNTARNSSCGSARTL